MKELRFHGQGIITGHNSLDYLANIEGKRIFVTTGGESMFKNGTIARIKKLYDQSAKEYFIHSGIKVNPGQADVMRGLEKMREFQPDVLVAVGGGSALDASKVMALLYEYPEYSLERAITGDLPQERKKLKLVAIPSTSGTATEVTRAAVITFDDLKIGLKTPAFIPDIAILDAQLTLSMPQNVVAETGMDAVTHAVECYINKNLDDFTECLAKGAVEGLFTYLPRSFAQGDYTSREKVHHYQCMAGCAFANVGLGMAHGISHAVGGMFHYGHGLINAVALPYVLEFNARDKEVEERLVKLGALIGEKDFIQAVRNLNNILEIPTSFREMGLEENECINNFAQLVENSLQGSTRVNPVPIRYEEMEELLRKIFKGS